MGAVVLVITGAEALYADMGHFGRRPIRVVLVRRRLPRADPQLPGPGRADRGATRTRSATRSTCWRRAGRGFPLVVLATVATIIASQAVISGAFSVSRQAVRLGYLPQLTVRHTSTLESGQIYVPAVNWLLFAGVLVLMAVFRVLGRAGDRVRAGGDRHVPAHHHPVPAVCGHRVALGGVEAHRRRCGVRRRRAHLLRREPDQDRGRGMAAAAGRVDRCHGDDDLAEGPTHRHRPPRSTSKARCRDFVAELNARKIPACPAPRSSRIRRR